MEPFDLQRTSVRRARKAHQCGACSEPIIVGESYEYIWAMWEGEAETHKTCLPCVAFRSALKVAFDWAVYPVADWDVFVNEARDYMPAEDFRAAVEAVVWPSWFPKPDTVS